MKKFIAAFAFLALLLCVSPDSNASASVLWDGMELKKGQIGRVTVNEPINLWKRSESGLVFVRILKKGERYRVYRMDSAYGGQFGLGGNLYITNIPERVKYETPSAEKRMLLGCESSCLIRQIVSLPQGSYDKGEADEILQRLETLPVPLLQQVYLNKISILLTNGPITDTSEFAYLRGITPRGWEGTNKTWDDIPGIGGTKTVAIRIGYSHRGAGHGSINLELHELAHSLDSIVKNQISSGKVFTSIWENEKENLFPKENYYTGYAEEFFAESFAMYYLDESSNKLLKKKAPRTYEFIRSMKWQ
ncbi:anthrax toxin lethal factor-related metalloendopeptidase [Bacillus sp. UMB0728]|nr:hypothetical protein [Bacillus sp. UMB0728]